MSDLTKINPTLLVERISEIKQSLEQIESISDKGQEAFLEDLVLVDSVKYRLLVVIEACISICSHITTRAFNKAPEGYADCFFVLGEVGVIHADLAQRLSEMARFRNMLVHIYREIDDKRLYIIITKDFDDVELFLSEIGDFIGKI